MRVIDTQRLRDAVASFRFYGKPSNASANEPCTNRDIWKIIDEVTKVLNVFIDEFEGDR